MGRFFQAAEFRSWQVGDILMAPPGDDHRFLRVGSLGQNLSEVLPRIAS
jgi:hypothetical protein